MIYFLSRADHYFFGRKGNFLGHTFFSHLQIVHDFYWWANTLLKNCFNIRNQHKDSREDLLDFSPWHDYFFQQFILCRNFYIFAQGGITHLSYTVTLRRFVISILQKMPWINCSPTMVDCGPSIKQHCARGIIHWTEAP